MAIENSSIARFIRSTSFKHIKSLIILEPSGRPLQQLIRYLENHPRQGLALELHNCKGIDAETIAQLTTLPLAALGLKGDVSHATLAALAHCRFPVHLTGTFGERALVAASRISALQSLAVYGGEIVDDDMAALFSGHPALQMLSTRIGANASSGAIAALALIPQLRHLSLACWEAPHFDTTAARAVAANSTLQSLDIRGQNLSEASFIALSKSVSLTSLKTEVRQGMSALAKMALLKALEFVNDASMDWTTITTASANSIAALPALTSLVFDKSISFEPGALATIVENSPVTRLEIREWYTPDDLELSALLANTSLRELALAGSTMPEQHRVALCNHPTLERFNVNREEYRRRHPLHGV